MYVGCLPLFLSLSLSLSEYMRACMHVCKHVRICMCMTHIHIRIRSYIYIYIHTHKQIKMHTCTCSSYMSYTAYTCIYVCMYVCMCLPYAPCSHIAHTRKLLHRFSKIMSRPSRNIHQLACVSVFVYMCTYTCTYIYIAN